MSAYKQQNTSNFQTWILIFTFVSIISGICYFLSVITRNPSIFILGFAFSIGQSFIGYFFGGSLAIASAGGQEVSADQSPEIHEMISNLSKVAGIPKPKIFISPDQSANAFACGRNPENANICLNQGLMNILDKNELEGVIAHELSHIKNRDILIMTITMVLSSVITFITDFGFRTMFFGGGKDDEGNNRSPLVLIFYVVLMILGPIVSLLISMAVSRQREFAADATAVTFTRYPNGLINALEKLYKSPVPTEHFSTSTNHFYIAPPKKTFNEKIQTLFSTHPTIEERVLALREM
jgi:heat shock protein HtpX